MDLTYFDAVIIVLIFTTVALYVLFRYGPFDHDDVMHDAFEHIDAYLKNPGDEQDAHRVLEYLHSMLGHALHPRLYGKDGKKRIKQ